MPKPLRTDIVVAALLLEACGCAAFSLGSLRARSLRPPAAQAAAVTCIAPLAIPPRPVRRRSGRGPPLLAAAAGGDSGDDAPAADGSGDLFASLRARQESLKDEQAELLRRWRSGECSSRNGLALDDWIRRMSLDWPLVATGSAGGSVVVADVNKAQLIAEARDVHPAYIETMAAEMEMRLLHGDYDGGGVTALAFSLSNTRLVSGGRDGRVIVWSFDVDEGKLERIATLDCGKNAVSSVVLGSDGKTVWTGGLDGKIRRWESRLGEGGEQAFSCEATHDMGAAVLCLHLDGARGRLLAGTADGFAVALHAAAESSSPLADSPPPSVVHRWRPHMGARTRSIACCGGGGTRGADGSASRLPPYIVTGGSDGSMVQLLLDDEGSFAAPEQVDMLPNHNGQVVSLCPVLEGDLFVTGAQDGTIRVWDMKGATIKDQMRETPLPPGPKCLYGLAGYKVP
jgi:WD40 repeat protein